MMNKDDQPSSATVTWSVSADGGVVGEVLVGGRAGEFCLLQACNEDVVLVQECGEFMGAVLDAVAVELEDG